MLFSNEVIAVAVGALIGLSFTWGRSPAEKTSSPEDVKPTAKDD